MWVTVFFDLPTATKQDIKNYTRFRKGLLQDGFVMLQYSVYTRHCASDEHAQIHCKRIQSLLPPKGQVRILRVTEKQFERMQVYWGTKSTPVEPAPQQITLF